MSFEFDGLPRSTSASLFPRLQKILVGASLALLTLPVALPVRASVDESGVIQALSIAPSAAPMPRLFAVTPERRALLNTIRFAEGTWANGNDIGYRVMFGGGLMDSLERHPDRVIRSSRYASAAAGAYQFMPFTWALASRVLGLPGFGPFAQDQAALLLIQRRGALVLADQGQLTSELAARLAPEWASFPTTRGSSYYGQPVKRLAELKRFYEWNLAQLRGATAPTAVPVASLPTPACASGQLECLLESAASPARGN
jgi:lysozyme